MVFTNGLNGLLVYTRLVYMCGFCTIYLWILTVFDIGNLNVFTLGKAVKMFGESVGGRGQRQRCSLPDSKPSL